MQVKLATLNRENHDISISLSNTRRALAAKELAQKRRLTTAFVIGVMVGAWLVVTVMAWEYFR